MSRADIGSSRVLSHRAIAGISAASAGDFDNCGQLLATGQAVHYLPYDSTKQMISGPLLERDNRPTSIAFNADDVKDAIQADFGDELVIDLRVSPQGTSDNKGNLFAMLTADGRVLVSELTLQRAPALYTIRYSLHELIFGKISGNATVVIEDSATIQTLRFTSIAWAGPLLDDYDSKHKFAALLVGKRGRLDLWHFSSGAQPYRSTELDLESAYDVVHINVVESERPAEKHVVVALGNGDLSHFLLGSRRSEASQQELFKTTRSTSSADPTILGRRCIHKIEVAVLQSNRLFVAAAYTSILQCCVFNPASNHAHSPGDRMELELDYDAPTALLSFLRTSAEKIEIHCLSDQGDTSSFSYDDHAHSLSRMTDHRDLLKSYLADQVAAVQPRDSSTEQENLRVRCYGGHSRMMPHGQDNKDFCTLLTIHFDIVPADKHIYRVASEHHTIAATLLLVWLNDGAGDVNIADTVVQGLISDYIAQPYTRDPLALLGMRDLLGAHRDTIVEQYHAGDVSVGQDDAAPKDPLFTPALNILRINHLFGGGNDGLEPLRQQLSRVLLQLMLSWLASKPSLKSSSLVQTIIQSYSVMGKVSDMSEDEQLQIYLASRSDREEDSTSIERCLACDSRIRGTSEQSASPIVSLARCDNGHLWPRCSVSLRPMSGRRSLTCTCCGRHAIPLQDHGTQADDHFLFKLYAAASLCLYCGGRWQLAD
ncbi:hypothetical protein PYCC9005_002121 [Savitreella phatthalungensis]